MKMPPHLTMDMNSSSTRSKLVLTISNTRPTSTSSIEDSDSISPVSTPSADSDSDGSELNVTSSENMIAKRRPSKESLFKDKFNSNVLKNVNINLEHKTSVSSDKSEPSIANSEEIDNLVDNFRTTSLTGNEFNDVTDKFRNLELMESNSEMGTAPSDSSKESNRTQGDVDNVRHEYSNEDQEIVNSSFDNTEMNTVNIFNNDNDTETETKKNTDDSQDDSSSDEDNYDLRSRGPMKKVSYPNRSPSTPYQRLSDGNQIEIHDGIQTIMEDARASRIMNDIFTLMDYRPNSSASDEMELNNLNIPYMSNTQFTGTYPTINSSVSNSPLSMTDEPNIMPESYGNYQSAVGNHNTEITTNIESPPIYSANNSPSPFDVQPAYNHLNIALENGFDVPVRSPIISFYNVESPSIYQDNFINSPNLYGISDTQVVNNACEQSWQSHGSFNQISDAIEQTQSDLSSQLTPTNVPNFVSDSLESRMNLLDSKQNAGINTYYDIHHLEQSTPISLPVSSTTTSTVNLLPKTPGKIDIWRLLNLPVTNATRILERQLSEKHLFKAMSKILCKSNEELTRADNTTYTQLMHLVKDPDQMKNKRYRAYLIALVERIADIPGSLSAMNARDEDALYLAAINCPKMACISGYLAAAMVKRRIVISHNLYKGGNTLIHVVAAKGDTHIDVLSELLALKTNEGSYVFDFSKVNYCGKTALDMAVEAQNNTFESQTSFNDTVQLLLKHRADSIINETPSRTFKL